VSRSGYTEDCDEDWQLYLYRGTVTRAINGRRGQAFLRDLLAALDAMEVKELIRDELEHEGAVCAIGALGKVRGIDMAKLDPEDAECVADQFGIAPTLARETVYMNDEALWHVTPEDRWRLMRAWVVKNIKDTPAVTSPEVTP